MDCQKIDCQKLREYLYPFIDGELDREKIASVKEHISRCPLCKMEVKNEEEVNQIFKSCFPKEYASYEFKEKLLARVREESQKKKGVFSFLPHTQAVAAAVVAFILLGLIYIYVSRPFPVFQSAFGAHIEMTQGKVRPEVTSSDPKEILQALQPRFDFKVNVPDLSSHGAQLTGACVCHFRKKSAVHIIYDKEGYKISAFIFSSEGLKMPKAKKVPMKRQEFYIMNYKGYNSIFWSDQGIGCVITSDMDEADLLYLAQKASF